MCPVVLQNGLGGLEKGVRYGPVTPRLPWVKHWSPKRSIEPGGGGISRGYILLMSCFSSSLSPVQMFLICCVFKYIWHVINMCSSSTKPRKETQKEQKHLKVRNENSPRLVWMNVVDLMWINHPCLCFSLFIHFFDLVIFNLIVITESSGENSALVRWCAVSSCGA